MKRDIIAAAADGLGVLAVAAGIFAAGFVYKDSADLLKETTERVEALSGDLQVMDVASLETKTAELETGINELKQNVRAVLETREKAEQEAESLAEASADISSLAPGTILDAGQISEANLDHYFQAYEILEGDAVYNRIIGKSYQVNPYVALSDLRYLKVLHYNFDGNIQVGELIVNAKLAEDFISAFKSLYGYKYEIQSLYLIDNYWTGDGASSDNASIEVNNTSAFCYRVVTGGSSLSNHAYGCAIDINSQQNPYVTFDAYGNGTCYHANAQQYIDRNSGLEHVITHEDICYQVFTGLGFTWGGDWAGTKDYQHFEKAAD